jgi:hypothetical protein
MGTRITTALAALAAGAIWGGDASAATPAPVPVYRELRDWILACDNTRACFAKFDFDEETGKRPSDGDPGYLSVTRDAGPDGELTVALQGDEHAPDPAGFRLDGRPLPAFPWRRDDGEQTASLTGQDAVRFLKTIRNGALLTYSPAEDAPWVSLRGMSAALLAMDEDQDRLGSQTALIRTGPAPASAVPPPAPLPVLRAAPARTPLPNAKAFAAAVRRSQAKLIAADGYCQPEMKEADQAFALNDSEAIVLIGCMQAAYQASVLLFRAPRADPAKARQVIFPPQPTVDPKLVAEQGGAYIAEDGWDPKTASFSESAKGRGLADCGSSSTWTFDGKDFHLSSYNALNRCGGGPPGDWPTLWRTRVVTVR